jgi:hypothetical protein
VVISSELVSLWIFDSWNGENQLKNGQVMSICTKKSGTKAA